MQRFSAPIVLIFSAVLILAVLLSVMTYRNLRWEQEQMQVALKREGLTLIRTIEAGARTGMMGMMWGGDQTQTLLEEAAKQPEVAAIALINASGQITAHNNSQQIGRAFAGNLPEAQQDGIHRGIVRTPEGNLFLVARAFHPIQERAHMDSMGARWMSERWMSGPWMRRSSGNASQPQTIIVALKTDAYDQARATDIRNAALVGSALLLVGSAGIYLIFALHRNRLMQRTVGRLTDYTAHLIQEMPSGLVSLDREGRVVTVNPAAAEILGRSQVEMQERNYRDLWQCPPLERVLTGEQVSVEQEIECVLGDGSQVTLGLTATALHDDTGEGTGVICLFRDLTETKRLQTQLQRADRLATIGQFAAAIAHEIRNPLNTLKGFAQYLHGKVAPETDQRRYTELMVQESERLNRIITELLDFSRPLELELVEVDINQVLSETLFLIQRDADAQGVQVKQLMAPETPPVPVDSEKLKQVFLNLLINALQAMPEGGTLQITSQVLDEWVEARIADSGHGVPAEDIPRLFDPFFSRRKGGTGLGLAVVHRLVEAHNGTIEVESVQDVGTVFVLRFPIVRHESAAIVGESHE